MSVQRLSVFGDYKLSFSSNEPELKGGGSLETDVVDEPRDLRRRPTASAGGAGPGRAYLAGTNRAGKRFTNPGRNDYMGYVPVPPGKFRFRRPSHILRTCYRFPPLIGGLEDPHGGRASRCGAW